MSKEPNYAVSPGDYIQEWLDENAMNAAELARRLDVTPKHVSELLAGKAPLSQAVALSLERVTTTPARLWNRTESLYREDLARLAEEGRLAEQYETARLFPLKYLRDWGLISAAARDKAGTVRELLAILRIGHLDAFDASWVHARVAYRKTVQSADKRYERGVWLALGERQLELTELPDFDKAKVKALIPQLRALTADADPVAAFERVASLLHEAGVALHRVPPVPGFGVYGATRWIAGHPLIQVSERGKTDDQFWFTLFHELGHVLLHGDKTVFLQGSDGTHDTSENEADAFAAHTLVPDEFHDRLPLDRDEEAVRKLAAELGIAPSIVLEQAQKITADFSWGHDLQISLEWGPAVKLEGYKRSAEKV